MAKRQRDYAAEYRRRLELGRGRGQSRAQARRGARKYAAAPPGEAAARRKRMAAPVRTRGQMGRAGWIRQEYGSLRELWGVAAAQDPFTQSYVSAKGRLSSVSPRDDSTGDHQWRSITSTALPDYYDQEAYAEARVTVELLFTAPPSRYALLSRPV